MLTKVKPARERILLIGGFGCGKSYAWCTIALWQRRSKSPGRVFVVDTDHAVDRLSEGYDEHFFDNVIHRDVWDYKETKKALEDFAKESPTREDVLVVDLVDKLWTWSQEHHISEKFGKDAVTYYVEHAKAGKDGHPLAGDYGMEWHYANMHYGALMTMIQRWPGHVILCAPADPVEQPNAAGKGGDDKEVRSLYGRAGVKAKGQKALGFQSHTVLWMIDASKRNEPEWRFTTIKDLHREHVTNVPMKDFVMDYLIAKAGWVMDG